MIIIENEKMREKRYYSWVHDFLRDDHADGREMGAFCFSQARSAEREHRIAYLFRHFGRKLPKVGAEDSNGGKKEPMKARFKFSMDVQLVERQGRCVLCSWRTKERKIRNEKMSQ